MSFVLGIITARGGSKGIEDKNITLLADKPLIQYTIEAAQNSSALGDLILSTDSQKISDCAATFELKCNELRPAHLATDEAKSCDVIRYEIDNYEARTGQRVDTIILLQPTAPLRTSRDIDDAYAIYEDRNSNQSSLISCYNAESVHPRIMYRKERDHLTPLLEEGRDIIRRQKMFKAYVRNGALYIVDRDYFMETGKTICESPALYEMSKERSINIDSPEDLELASFYLQRAGDSA